LAHREKNRIQERVDREENEAKKKGRDEEIGRLASVARRMLFAAVRNKMS